MERAELPFGKGDHRLDISAAADIRTGEGNRGTLRLDLVYYGASGAFVHVDNDYARTLCTEFLHRGSPDAAASSSD
jgi:hypothetical protein